VRLILLIDPSSNFLNEFTFRTQDVLISERKVEGNFLAHDRIYELSDFDVKRADYVKSFNDIIDQSPPLLFDIIRAHGHSFFNNVFTHFLKWITAIDILLKKYQITELVFSDYAYNFDYIPYYESEGEINAGIFYKKYDFIPRLLVTKYKNRYNISIIKYHNSSFLKCRIFVRRYALLCVKLFYGLFRKILSIFNKNKKICNSKSHGYLTIMISRGVAHTDFMIEHVKQYKEDVLLSVGEGLFNYGKNINKVRSAGISNYFFENSYISIIDYFRAFFCVLKLLFYRNKGDYNITVSDFDFNFKSSIHEFIIHHYESFLHQLFLDNLLSEIKRTSPDLKIAVITGEFYGPYSYVTGLACKKYNIPSFQLQNFICDIVQDVDFLNCDYILFYSKQELDKFSYYFPDLSNHFFYWGNIKLDLSNKNVRELKYSVLKIIYFSQPILFDQEEQLIIESLISLRSDVDCEIAIKVHPRDDLSRFMKYNNLEIKLYGGGAAMSDYIHDYNLAIIQTSAVGQQIILEGVPIVICQLSNFSLKIKPDFIVESYKGYIKNIKDIKLLVKEYPLLLEAFKKYRHELIQINEWEKNSYYFNNKIRMFLDERNQK
jgi:hypothetical protein